MTVRFALPGRTFPSLPKNCFFFIPKPSSYGCNFIKLYLLKVSGGGESAVEAHILGLGRIQLERIHKAGTRTKLLAVLV